MAHHFWSTALLGAGIFAGLTSSAQAASSITAKEAAAKVQAGQAVLIDVREADELKYGKAAPAISLPLSEVKAHSALYKSVVAGLDKQKEVIVYCVSGARSKTVAKDLEGQGFKTTNLGSFKLWEEAGLPVVKG